MQSREVEIINRLGMHARAAAKFVATASEFDATIEIGYNGKRVNGKSIMGVMMLAAARGAGITIHAEGADEDGAIGALEALVNSRFGEDE